ncbi:MAG: acetate--CoA ligase family protein [Halobacteriales archaeon]
MEGLDALVRPRRVAVVGATDREGAVGRAILENLRASYEGEVVPVNPNHETVLGQDCVANLAAAGDVDLAVVVVPPEVAIRVAEEAGEAGVRALVVITAGFEEAGEAGAERAARLAAIAERYDLRVVGPNSLGVMSTASGLNATFAQRMPAAGSVSFMSQSGAFVTAVLDWAGDQGIGFRHVVSLGNKLDVDEATLLERWNDDPGTEAIIGYVESIERGRRFMDAARRVTPETPVVLVKAGRTEAGAKAAASHTGAMAGSERVIDAALAQTGVVRSPTASGLFDAAQALAGQPVPDGPGVAIVSNAGGPAVLATDATAETDLVLAEFADETLERLGEVLPPAADPYNPVDIIGDADVERFRRTLEVVADDPGVDMLLTLSAPLALLDYADLAAMISSVNESIDLPIVACLMGGREQTDAARERLAARDIPNFVDPARAVGALDALETYRRHCERPVPSPPPREVDRERAAAVLEAARTRDRPTLGLEALGLLEAYGIATPAGGLATSPAEAARLAADVPGDAVVLKVVSPEVSHKSDIGGVRVGVPVEEVPEAYEDLATRVHSYREDARLLGVYVQELVDLDDAVEVIVGANRDPQFGPAVLFGLGGIFVELLEDVTLRVTPVDEPTARSMLDEVAAAPVLRGARGRPQVDRDGIVDAILGVAALVEDHPEVLELDINPLVATPEGVLAADLRLTIDLP